VVIYWQLGDMVAICQTGIITPSCWGFFRNVANVFKSFVVQYIRNQKMKRVFIFLEDLMNKLKLLP